MKLKKVATWHNDGSPGGRWVLEPGHEPPREPLLFRLACWGIPLGYVAFVIYLARLVNP